ncbi:MAG: hypothetical protein ISR52_07105 [Rhodospirillales bacterium]|nr:hypothetical protein [Rhodospirillales bacterium]
MTKNDSEKDPVDQRQLVGTTIHIHEDTFDLLRDVALARAIKDVAAASKKKKKIINKHDQSISKVIEDLVEKYRTALENEVIAVRNPKQSRHP